jgi:proline/betaine transport protein TphA
MLLTGIMAMSFYFYMGYFNTFLIKTLGHATQPIMIINFISQVSLALLMPFFGWLSDKKGRKPIFKMGILGLLVGSYPVFYCLQQALPWVLMGELLFIMLIAPLIALLPTMLAEMFQVKNRNTGIALGYNLGQALFGGTAPLIALSLTQGTHNLYAPAWYLMAASFLSLLTLFFIKESYQQTLT